MSVLDDVIECYVENQLVLGWEKERPISGFDERSEFPGTKVGELLYLWDEDGLSSFVIVGKEGDYAVIVNHGTKYAVRGQWADKEFESTEKRAFARYIEIQLNWMTNAAEYMNEQDSELAGSFLKKFNEIQVVIDKCF